MKELVLDTCVDVDFKEYIQDESTFTIHVENTLIFKDYQLFKEKYLSLKILPRRILVDFSRTEKIDCSGLSMLLTLRDFCQDKDIQLQLENVSHGNVPQMLEMAKFHQHFAIQATKTEEPVAL